MGPRADLEMNCQSHASTETKTRPGPGQERAGAAYKSALGSLESGCSDVSQLCHSRRRQHLGWLVVRIGLKSRPEYCGLIETDSRSITGDTLAIGYVARRLLGSEFLAGGALCHPLAAF